MPVEVLDGEGTEELLVKNGEEITISYDVVGHLAAPVEQGAVVGRIRYQLGDEVLKECRVVAAKNIEKIDFAWCLLRVRELLWL